MEVLEGLIKGNEFWQMVSSASPLAKVVLLILLALSLGCWMIICYKYLAFRSMEKNSRRFLRIFRSSPNLKAVKASVNGMGGGHLVELFSVGYEELWKLSKGTKYEQRKEEGLEQKEVKYDGVISQVLSRVLTTEILVQQTRMEKYLGFLATTGNTAPFVGLFGTVWGIMDSFRHIGIKGSASLAVVAPGIAEALIATAAGIAVAVPAVVAFNVFTNKVSQFRSEMDAFSSEFLAIVERALLRG